VVIVIVEELVHMLLLLLLRGVAAPIPWAIIVGVAAFELEGIRPSPRMEVESFDREGVV
jgi:hypothetical protein